MIQSKRENLNDVKGDPLSRTQVFCARKSQYMLIDKDKAFLKFIKIVIPNLYHGYWNIKKSWKLYAVSG